MTRSRPDVNRPVSEVAALLRARRPRAWASTMGKPSLMPLVSVTEIVALADAFADYERLLKAIAETCDESEAREAAHGVLRKHQGRP